MARCAGIRADGERCKGVAATGNDFCPAHDPARAEARREAARKAGRIRQSPHSREVSEVKQSIRELADGVLSGKVNRGDAAVAAQLLNVWLRASEVQRRWYETDDLGARLERLSDVLERRGETG